MKTIVFLQKNGKIQSTNFFHELIELGFQIIQLSYSSQTPFERSEIQDLHIALLLYPKSLMQDSKVKNHLDVAAFVQNLKDKCIPTLEVSYAIDDLCDIGDVYDSFLWRDDEDNARKLLNIQK